MSNDWQFYFLELVLFSLRLEQPPRLSVNRFLCSLYKWSPFLDPGVISESNHSSRVQVLSLTLRTILHGQPTRAVTIKEDLGHVNFSDVETTTYWLFTVSTL